MATGTAPIGQLQEFNPDNETISAYLERFELYMSVNGIAAEKKVSTLLLLLGRKHYTLIRGLVSPEKPENKSFEDLKSLLENHYSPEPIVIAERFNFYQRNQKSGESIADYVACLRRLASTCKFKTFLSEALRDKLVCGLNSEAIQKSLLAKKDLTLETAMDIALGMEAAAKRAKELKSSRSIAILKVAPVSVSEKAPPSKPWSLWQKQSQQW